MITRPDPHFALLYDYIFRAMPLNAPQSLTADEVYALVAWLLHQNGIIRTYRRSRSITVK